MNLTFSDFIDLRIRQPYKRDELTKFVQDIEQLQLPDFDSLPEITEEEKQIIREDFEYKKARIGLEDAWLEASEAEEPVPILRDTVVILMEVKDFIKKVKDDTSDDNIFALEKDWHRLSTKEDQAGILPNCILSMTEILFTEKKESAQQKLKEIIRERLKLDFEWPSLDGNKYAVSVYKSFVDYLRSVNAFSNGNSGHPLFLEVFVEPYANQFRYHFMSKRQTNLISKPEWFYEYLLKTFRSLRAFFLNLRKCEADSFFFLFSDFILMLNDLVKEKLSHIAKYDDYLVHLTHETLHYTVHLKQYFGSDHDYLIDFLFCQPSIYDKWLNLEAQQMNAKLNDIKSSKDAWDMAVDQANDYNFTVPTKTTIRFRDMMESTYATLRLLPSFKYKRDFFEKVQLEPLQQYVQWLQSFYEAHESSQSEALPGSLQLGRQNETTEVERMCKLYSNFHLLKNWIDDYEDEEIYIEIGSHYGHKEHSAFFVMKNRIDVLKKGSFRLILRAAIQMLQPLVNDYADIDTWVIKEQPLNVDIATSPVSSEILKIQSSLRNLIRTLESLLSGASLREVIYQLGIIVGNWFVKIIMSHQFSLRGGIQYTRDIMQILLEFSYYPLLTFKKLTSSIELLSLDLGKEMTIRSFIKAIKDDNHQVVDQVLKEKGIELQYSEVLDVLYRRVEAWKD
ncbi:RINT1 family protein [Schizosaccharomyces cryophilus OY26]|uniref:RINT1 family protein n=1 Tax=Schizosaccharomyces cryophilus (strain OY26 / ATCC MYA-4695 / CBS 11777 / NBRC 106824 / NRRL Y48691) TaxID=653667 RepID=S9VSU6_SCHCR|nr:RINT1 family protein [Schizosaccharomyces cryophilus OY26]EPY49244.1 RINT1 family protein [Schizosaccharomyces cryophilus OY26]